MKKSLLIMLLVLACVLALTACSGGIHTHVKDSNGLEFTLNADKKSYSVTGIGIFNDTDIVIPSVCNGLPVTIIGDSAFHDCNSLTSIEIPDGVTSIGDYAFFDCDSLTSVVIPDSVTSIGDSAFRCCASLTSVVIPDSVTSIADSAFSSCYSLTSVVIPDSVTSIGDYAFSSCNSLTSVVIPNSVTSIADSAFYWCESLTSINVSENNKNYKSIDGNLYSKDGTTLIQYAIGKTDASFTIPDSVTSIGDSAFSRCESLTSIEIPKSVTSIANSAFHWCEFLTSINVSENNKNYKSIDGNLYSKDGTTLIQYATGKTDASFTIPDSVTSIGSYAFHWCDSLTSIEIPKSVTSIGDSAFSYCDSPTIYCEATSQPSGWDSDWNSFNCPVVWGYTENQSNKQS